MHRQLFSAIFPPLPAVDGFEPLILGSQVEFFHHFATTATHARDPVPEAVARLEPPILG